MNESKDLSDGWEWVLERAAKDLGISVGELKRRLVPPKLRVSEVERARALGAPEWVVEAIKNCPTDFIQDIRKDHQNAPRGPSQAGASGQITKVSSNAGLPGTVNTGGWREPPPLGPQPGINHVDRLMDAADRADRAALIQREEAIRRAEKLRRG
jgi:hypothetical protein